MSDRTHHLCFSCARADNGGDNNRFITRFHDLLRKEHEAAGVSEVKTLLRFRDVPEGFIKGSPPIPVDPVHWECRKRLRVCDHVDLENRIRS